MFRKIFAGLLLVAASTAANAVVVYSEGFDNVAGLGASGWVQTNNSIPLGVTGWFQGNSGVFESQAGAADSYIAANFLNAGSDPITGAGGNVDNWLISPLLTLTYGQTVSIFTRTAGGFPGDTLQLLYSTGSTNVADFLPFYQLGEGGAPYPTDWAQISAIYGGETQGIRLAYRYLVTDNSVNGDYIGIDSFEVSQVPEPTSLALLGAGLLLIPVALRRRRNRV